ncbi:MAG: hypothetical protein ACTSYU_04205, partial [Promethearchaeota archaeon]
EVSKVEDCFGILQIFFLSNSLISIINLFLNALFLQQGYSSHNIYDIGREPSAISKSNVPSTFTHKENFAKKERLDIYILQSLEN